MVVVAIGLMVISVWNDTETADEIAEIDTAVLTPHNAALTVECAERMALVSVQNVLDFFAGTLDPALVVNRAALGGIKEPAK